MGFVRTCFDTDMSFDQKGELTARIRMYWADPDAKMFPGPHLFGADLNEVAHQLDALGPGEIARQFRTYYNGAMPGDFPGQGSFCGDPDWWLHGVPSDAPPVILDPWGTPFCCPGCHGIPGTVPFWFNGHHPAKITLLPLDYHYVVSQGPTTFDGTYPNPAEAFDDVFVFTTELPIPGHPAPMNVTWVSSVYNEEVDMDPCSYDPLTGTSVWRTRPGEKPPNPYRIVIVYPEH